MDSLVVVPTGSLQHGVAFLFVDKYGHRQPPLFQIERVDVLTYERGRGSTRIWFLEGSAARHFVIYGAKYRGLKTSYPAEKLARDQKYEVVVNSSTNGGDVVDFSIDQNGLVVPAVR